MDNLNKLLENNKAWATSKKSETPQYFSEMAKGQAPKLLWIGCSDSRVPVSDILGVEPGEVFVHRNVANLVSHKDFNSLAVLDYSINALKIPDVVVCGHYNCGGVMGAMQDEKIGLVDHWIHSIRCTKHNHRDELDQIEDPKAECDRLVELNVMKQVKTIAQTSIAQGAWKRGQPLKIHGWVYDIATGLIKDLECTISGPEGVDKEFVISKNH